MTIDPRLKRGMDERETLEKKLQKVRHESLIATRRGDFRKVAQLTLEAAQLNQSIENTADLLYS